MLDCQGSHRGFALNAAQTPETLIAGLTVMRCNAANGGAITISEGAPRIQRMVFASNVAQLSGGAISLQASAGNATAIEVCCLL